jgi:hypothetical protein
MNMAQRSALKSIFFVGIFFAGLVVADFVDTDVVNLESYPLVGVEDSSFYRLFDAGELPLARSMSFAVDDGPGCLWKSTAPLRERNVVMMKSLGESFFEKSEIGARVFGELIGERAYVFRDYLTTKALSETFPFLENKDLVALLDSFSFSQERAGILLSWKQRFKKLSFMVDVPLFLQASHPWIPLEQQKKGFSGISGENVDVSEDTEFLTKQHMADLMKQVKEVRVNGGLGDVRLTVHYHQKVQQKLKTLLGVSVIVPTQSFFTNKRRLGYIPQNEGFNPGWEAINDSDQLYKLASRLISSLQAIGLEPQLGQKALSVGLLGGVQVTPGSKTRLYAAGELVYNMPVSDYRLIHRYFMNSGVKTLADEPGEYLVRSQPGEILRASAGVRQDWAETFTFDLSTDLFLQKSEKIIEVFTEIEKRDNLFTANNGESTIDSATMNGVRQGILRLKIEKRINLKGKPATLSFDASKTIFASGVGKLWSVGIAVSSTF